MPAFICMFYCCFDHDLRKSLNGRPPHDREHIAALNQTPINQATNSLSTIAAVVTNSLAASVIRFVLNFSEPLFFYSPPSDRGFLIHLYENFLVLVE
jgi:hypothetical protein